MQARAAARMRDMVNPPFLRGSECGWKNTRSLSILSTRRPWPADDTERDATLSDACSIKCKADHFLRLLVTAWTAESCVHTQPQNRAQRMGDLAQVDLGGAGTAVLEENWGFADLASGQAAAEQYLFLERIA